MYIRISAPMAVKVYQTAKHHFPPVTLFLLENNGNSLAIHHFDLSKILSAKRDSWLVNLPPPNVPPPEIRAY